MSYKNVIYLNGLNNLNSFISSKKLQILKVGSFLAPKWPIIQFFTNNWSDTLSVGGWWGQPVLLFWKLCDKTQMSNPCDNAARDIPSKFSIFLPLRAIYFRSYQYETPCRINQSCTQTNKKSIRLGIITTRSIKNGVS